MRRIGLGLLYAAGGYVAAAVAGYVLVLGLSSNAHDRGVEAAMTGIFFVGPLGAVVGFIVGAVRGGRARPVDASRP